MIAQFLKVTQVVVYQASIFNAQWLIGALTQLGEKRSEIKDYNYEAWLAIEITSFYLLVAGAVLYIAIHMIGGMVWPDRVLDVENN